MLTYNSATLYACRFDIRLMQTGRMKGQAFVGLPEGGVAARALQETNGYMLHGKPMVVVSTKYCVLEQGWKCTWYSAHLI